MVPRLGLFRQKAAATSDAQRAMLAGKAAYGVFRCKDGRYLTIAALEEHFWHGLNAALGLFAADDACCATHAARTAHADAINARPAECVAEYDADALMARRPTRTSRCSRCWMPRRRLRKPARSGRASRRRRTGRCQGSR